MTFRISWRDIQSQNIIFTSVKILILIIFLKFRSDPDPNLFRSFGSWSEWTWEPGSGSEQSRFWSTTLFWTQFWHSLIRIRNPYYLHKRIRIQGSHFNRIHIYSNPKQGYFPCWFRIKLYWQYTDLKRMRIQVLEVYENWTNKKSPALERMTYWNCDFNHFCRIPNLDPGFSWHYKNNKKIWVNFSCLYNYSMSMKNSF